MLVGMEKKRCANSIYSCSEISAIYACIALRAVSGWWMGGWGDGEVGAVRDVSGW